MKNLKFEKVSNKLTKEEMNVLKGGVMSGGSGSGGAGGAGGSHDCDTWIAKQQAWQNDKDGCN